MGLDTQCGLLAQWGYARRIKIQHHPGVTHPEDATKR